MEPSTLFTSADAALRSVLDRLSPEDLGRPVPREWSRIAEQPTMRDILFAHAYDEAWVPDVLAGKALADGDPYRDADLLGDDPVAAYDALNDRANAAVAEGVAGDRVLRFQYGDYPAREGLTHLAMYRAFSSWSIAHHLGIEHRLGPELVAGLNEHVMPHADEWRQYGVFPPAIEPPAGADEETRLLCAAGYWKP